MSRRASNNSRNNEKPNSSINSNSLNISPRNGAGVLDALPPNEGNANRKKSKFLKKKGAPNQGRQDLNDGNQEYLEEDSFDDNVSSNNSKKHKNDS